MTTELLTNAEHVEQYYDHSQLQWEWAHTALSRFPINENSRVLDIGCRDGKITAELSKKIPFGRIVGLDHSHEMIRFAASHFNAELYPNLSFEEGNILNFSFKEKFDVIVSFAALNWMQDQQTVLKNIYHSLTQSGKVLLVLPGNSDTTLKSLGDSVRNRSHWKDKFQGYSHNRWYFTPSEYRDLLDRAGFSRISVQCIDTETVFTSIDELMQWWTPVSTAVQFLPQDSRSAFLMEVMQLYLSHYPSDAEGITLHWPMIEAIAEKEETRG